MPFGGALTVGLIGAGTSLLGGITGASAAKKAAAAQAASAAAAAKEVRQAAVDVNPQIINAGANASDLALRAGGHAEDTAATAAGGVRGAAVTANNLLNPYTASGSKANDVLSSGLAPGGQFNAQPKLSDLQIDPSFDFIRKNMETDLNRAAAARGVSNSGGTLKDLTNYEEGSLSKQYQQAFENFQNNRQNNFSDVNAIAGRGAAVAGQQGSNTLNAEGQAGGFLQHGADVNVGTGEFAGNASQHAADLTANNTLTAAERAGEYTTQQGNAQASGTVGAANAFNGALQGIGSAAGGALGAYQNNQIYQNYLQNPTTPGFVPYANAKPYNPNDSYGGANIPSFGAPVGGATR